MFAHGETVTVLTAGLEEDPYSGEFVPSWEWMPSEREVQGVAVADGGSVEPLQPGRESVVSDYDLIFWGEDPGVTHDNRVIVRGITCSVVGRPFPWPWVFTGGIAGTVVKVKIVEG